MTIDIGYFCLLASLALVLYSIFAGIYGIKRNSDNLIQSVRISHLAIFALVAIAYLSLTHAFVTNDFTVDFVVRHSSTDLPLFYKLTAVWGGMEGSLLLWQLILTFFTAIVVFSYRKANHDILPHTLIVLASISAFLLFLLIGWSNPFARSFPVPAEGLGLNPLLQNPGMVYHPPSLYLGYVGFSVPFAFAVGSLLRGKLDNNWILATRRWTLFSWFILTVGIILGAQWAYVELGWGGYWAWDPVENASLMPWLTGTAFLHSVIVQEKRNTLKIWNMVLIITTFLLTILGTFITRSGVLGSVHAFSKSNIGPAFLVFIAVMGVFAFGCLLKRQSELASESRNLGIVSKENSFLMNNIVFLVMAFTVLYGTIFPLLAEGLADKKLSIQAPFFNTIMTPLAVLMVLLMGITHFLGWKRTSAKLLFRNLLVPLLITLAAVIALAATTDFNWRLLSLAGTTVFAGCIIIIELVQSIRIVGRSTASKKESWFRSVFRDKRRRGGLIIHFGIALFAIGVCGSFFNVESSFTFGPGETKEIQNYQLTFEKTIRFRERNARNEGIEIRIDRDQQTVGRLVPVKAFYPTSPQPMTEVAIRRTLAEDLYISLSSINRDGSATIVVYINPLVNFIWISMIFITIGMIYSLSYKPAQFKKLRV